MWAARNISVWDGARSDASECGGCVTLDDPSERYGVSRRWYACVRDSVDFVAGVHDCGCKAGGGREHECVAGSGRKPGRGPDSECGGNSDRHVLPGGVQPRRCGSHRILAGRGKLAYHRGRSAGESRVRDSSAAGIQAICGQCDCGQQGLCRYSGRVGGIGSVRGEERGRDERTFDFTCGPIRSKPGQHEALRGYGTAGEGEFGEWSGSPGTVGRRNGGQHAMLKREFYLGTMRHQQQRDGAAGHSVGYGIAERWASRDLRCVGREIQTQAGKRRSDARHAGREVLDGFRMDAVADDGLEHSGSEDCIAGRVSRGRGWFRDLLSRLHSRDRHSGSGEGDGRNVCRKRQCGNADVHHRECACQRLHNFVSDGGHSGSVDCSQAGYSFRQQLSLLPGRVRQGLSGTAPVVCAAGYRGERSNNRFLGGDRQVQLRCRLHRGGTFGQLHGDQQCHADQAARNADGSGQPAFDDYGVRAEDAALQRDVDHRAIPREQ